MAVLSKGDLFPPVLVTEMFNAVQGRSSLAVLCGQKPVPMNGKKEFTFSLDKEVDIVAENGKKSPGGGTITPRTVMPIKFEYSMRTSDEFMFGSDEYKLDVLRQFSEGFARKIARGIDLAAFHGVNPRTGTASEVVGTNHFDSQITQTVEFAEATADDSLDSATALIKNNNITGFAFAPEFAAAMGKIAEKNGVLRYPGFRFGGKPESFAGKTLEINSTVREMSGDKDYVILGDFANRFTWGYAKEIPLRVIEYGNPDNDADQGDLQGRNQVLLRAEAYVGWAILDPTAFARVVTAAE